MPTSENRRAATADAAAHRSAPEGVAPDRLPRVAVIADTLSDLRELRLPLDIPGAEEARGRRRRVLTELEVRLLPRLREDSAPAIVVLGGSSGAGKSTLLNSLVGEEISLAGVLRPTTRTAILAAHTDDAPALEDNPLLELAHLVPTDEVPRGVAVLDAPDLDSVEARNRQLSARLVEAADLWVFVTTPVRYGDELPWSALAAAHARGVTVAVVLNRAGDRVRRDVEQDLTRRLQALGASDAPIFVVPDVGPNHGPLPPARVAELRQWLALVARSRAGSMLRRQTTRTTWAALREDLLAIADAADAQVRRAEDLTGLVDDAVAGPLQGVRADVADPALAHGSPTTRWLALASTGGPLARLAARPSRLRAGRSRVREERRRAAVSVGAQVDGPVHDTILRHVRVADAAMTSRWEDGGAAEILAGERVHRSRGPEALAERAVEGWQDAVAEEVAAVLPGTVAAEALGADGVAGLVRAAAAGLAGPATALRGLFPADGERLVQSARERLADLAQGAVRDVARPYADVLRDLAVDPGTAVRLRAGELKEFT
ncbi:hypothetical protein [Georgenia sp. Z1491]|uniref:GTPase domain-containing protein n=1 Tax=Georgenia sp. Z1491 TaxID=3416707 RepID=UPI003CF0E407